jgi:opacity protein-like surface antigen
MKKILLLTIFSMITSGALADVGDNYFSIKLGSSNSKNAGTSSLITQVNKSGTTTNNDLGRSDVLGISIGKYLSEHFRGEIGISQRKGFKYHTTAPALPENYYKADVESFAVFLNGYVDAQPMTFLQNSVTTYVGAGIGISRNKMNPLSIHSEGVLLGTASSNTETELALKFALGALINLSDNVSVDLNYQYVDLGDIESGKNLSWDTRDMVAPYSGPEISSTEFNVGLQIAF